MVQKSEDKDTGKKLKNKEYGLVINGPEPTRYGDWEIKGRCFDF